MLRKDPNRRRSQKGGRSSRGAGASRAEAGSSSTGRQSPNAFVLYVEGARDREILACWARRAEPSLARCIERNSFILGGRQPARALADFRKRGGAGAGLSGLIVLDRDHHEHEHEAPGAHVASDEAGLEVFVWSLRHIESYLLVPAALRRLLRVAVDDPRVERALADEVDREGIESGADSLHAKRILGAGGSLSEALGTELRAGDIARAMRPEDLHEDVRALLTRIGSLSGVVPKGPEVVVRSAASDD